VDLSREDVTHVARLARLAMTDEEIDRFRAQLSAILDHAARVSEAASDDVPPTSHALPLSNVFREDEVGECLSQSKALSTAPETEDGRFKVPRIIEEP
jgi:aspartyl-tRNA(Asn)/glutamyl-tRNA(Gln) amidotransferase subunit C